MASCSLATLQADACANGFLTLVESDPKAADAILLQLVSSLASNNYSVPELIKQACANGFFAADDKQGIAAELQLFCNLSEGLVEPVECINLIPEGSVYDNSGRFYVRGGGGGATLLQVGGTYLVTFGANESSMNDGSYGVTYLKVSSPSFQFTYAGIGSAGDIGCYFHSIAGQNLPVTATICEV